VMANKVHVPSDLIRAYEPRWGDGLVGDKTNSMVFDNTKIRRLAPGFAPAIPFSKGAREIIRWYDADPMRRQVDADANRLHDLLASKMRSIWPE